MSRAIAVSRGSVGEDASKAGWGQTLSQAFRGRARAGACGRPRQGATLEGSSVRGLGVRATSATRWPWDLEQVPPSDPPRFHLQRGRTISSPGDGENQSTLCGAVLAPLL